MDRNLWTNLFNSSNPEENPYNYPPQNSNGIPQNFNNRSSNFNFHPPNFYPPRAPYMMYPQDCYQYPPFMSPPHGPSYGSPVEISSKSTRRTSIDATSTDKESATPPSEQSSPFPSHSSPLGIENINLESDFDATNEEDNVVQRRRTRWTCKENEILAKCFIGISEDPVVGNDQKMEKMWKRIAKEYNKNRPADTPVRHWEAMKTHFYTTQRSVNSFNAEYISVKQGWGSGHNDADILMETLKKWEHKNNNKSFKLLSMWQILKDSPKWSNPGDRDYRGKKKLKTSVSGAYTSSSNNEDATEERVRPIGQKTTKKKGKAKSDEPYNEVKMIISNNMERYETIQQNRIQDIKDLNRINEYLVLTKDTTGMNSVALQAHIMILEDIKKKWGIQ